ncbi:MAG: uracil-DNA glycosylase [Candidatus Thioglobus sp.]|nr:uracil-DNA glycosylase [Candidatus Thioglobus sp.]MBT3446597.1 uracil-DNA glycosylase [Candidatus Thioglobus sp.]MBT3744650.1 uracil-DNA glycosylase [Candidatus Thioglobus sp.]MBT4001295.1 uracil-DNA glycosylase [Candidatus Thioglobus sp.]MBT4182382.1 uracil-DNA glycosylase [Candidatus Thioglobus sp.]
MVSNDWSIHLDPLFKRESYLRLTDFLTHQESNNLTLFPPKDQIFNAFELSNFKQTKVVIVGQDPYHNEHQAHGLSFSVPEGVKIPPSLRNIYQELELDLGIPPNPSGSLEHWAKQGVLLLNSALTVEKNSPGSHAKTPWVDFTESVIQLLSDKKQNLVFLLWGAHAQKKIELIDQNKHLVLSASHPSPFSAHKGFFGCKHFSKTNEYLKIHKLKSINW